MTTESPESPEENLPLVVSVCGTYLKPEMQSIYRQLTNLKRHRTIVYTERTENLEMFPFPEVEVMEKIKRPRLRGNFILRFWYKHVIKNWPPPKPINKLRKPYYPYNLPDLLQRDDPALVHVYYGHKAVKYLEMVEAWGGPWIVSFHGVDVVKFFDEDGYAERMKEVFASAELVLARSESLLDRLEALGCHRKKLRLNRTPIPLDRFPFIQRSAPADGKWRLLQACRLVAKKGLFTTLKALKRVVEVWPETTFVLCGDGPKADAFRAKAREVGLERHIEMLGWVDQDTLRSEYERAHLFLHPSELTETEDQEGVPNAMLEAMAAGLPVVSTYHGGIPEAVKDGVDGRLVPEKSPSDLAGALLELMGDSAKLAACSRGAANSVKKKYGLIEQLENLESCYSEAKAAFRNRAESNSK